MDRFSLANFPVQGRRAFLRVDYNVPLEKGRVQDDARIRATIPTIQFLLEKKCNMVIATHLGRPEGQRVREWKVNPLVEQLQKLLPKQRIIKLDDCVGEKIREAIEAGKPGEIFMLENLRFHREEEENKVEFAKALGSLADFFVNDAFRVPSPACFPRSYHPFFTVYGWIIIGN